MRDLRNDEQEGMQYNSGSNYARVLFRFQAITNKTVVFAAEAPLSDVYKYVNEELLE